MSELPVITYTDSEGQVFNFMSDLDDVRDYKRVLVPRTTPEEPQHYTPELIDSSESVDVAGVEKRLYNKYSYADITDIWNIANKYISGTVTFSGGESADFKLDYKQDSSFSIPGVMLDPIDETRSENIPSGSHNFKKISMMIIDSSASNYKIQDEFELDDDYIYSGYKFSFASQAGSQIVYTTNTVENLQDLEGETVSTSWGTTTTTLTINSVLIYGNKVSIVYTISPLIGNARGDYLSGIISSNYDDGEHSIFHRIYEAPSENTIIGGVFVNGYKDEYYSEFVLNTGSDIIKIPNGEKSSVHTDAGDFELTEIVKTYVGSTIHFSITFTCPSGITLEHSDFHYTHPSDNAKVYVESITEVNSISSHIRIRYPNSDDYTVTNVVLNADIEYEDDTIYGSLFYCGRIIDGSFHEFEWDKSVSERQFGETVNGWTKSSKEYKATLLFSGTDEQKRLALNRFHSAIENDIMHETPGTLQWDDATIDCYIRGSNTKPSDKFNGYTENEITIYCPRPFWEHEITQQFYSGINNSESDTTYAKNWPHDYSGYDYLFVNDRESYILNDGPMSEWQIIINGPAKKPKIQIGNNIIAMNTEIPVNSYLMIDSRDKIIYLVNPDGSMDNRFGERNLENYIFNKIEPGVNKVTWNGSYEWLLTLYEERSEPRWPY